MLNSVIRQMGGSYKGVHPEGWGVLDRALYKLVCGTPDKLTSRALGGDINYELVRPGVMSTALARSFMEANNA